MNEDLKKWARAQVEEQMRHMTRKMDKAEQDWYEAGYAYEKTFGVGFPSGCSGASWEEGTARMWRHIEEGKPLVRNVPEGAVL